ncbi:MAG: hypothetical protein LH465_04440 [Sphingomonas bacterium]|nr:hypothetical protein [Sphingomonas bacterium]
MVIRRIREHVASHNWFAVGIDLAIVVLGVLIATQVSNWNESRLEAAKAHAYRARLLDELDFNARQFGAQVAYYREVRAHGLAALAMIDGKQDATPRDFLVHAYQLSQIDTNAAKTYIYDEVTSAGLVNLLGDETTQAMASDYYLTLATNDRTLKDVFPYRSTIRSVMPFTIQKVIRAQCGDQDVIFRGRIVGISLPRVCSAEISSADSTAAMDRILAKPGLHEEMTRYVASIDEKVGVLSLDLTLTDQFKARLQSAR